MGLPFSLSPPACKEGKKIIQDIETILKNARSIIRIIKNSMVKSLHDENGKEEWINDNQRIKQESMIFDSFLYVNYRIEIIFHLDSYIQKVRKVYGELTLRCKVV